MYATVETQFVNLVDDDILTLPVTTESIEYIRVILKEKIVHLDGMLELYKNQIAEGEAYNAAWRTETYDFYIAERKKFIAADSLNRDLFAAYLAAL